MVQIALVDDHPLICDAMRLLFEERSDLKVVAQASDTREACQIAKTSDVDVFVLDIGLPGPDGFAATRELLRIKSGTRILILTMHEKEELAARALAAGAKGYALKKQPVDQLLEAVETVARGERYVAPSLRTEKLDDLLSGRRVAESLLSVLSQREREIFDMQIRGFSLTQVAQHLYISTKTVDTHRTHIYRKLGVHSMSELIRLAASEGLLLDP